jgi:hypothetical protein
VTTPDPAFFVPDGARLLATAHTRGPWSPEHQHAGPPSALLARAIEQAVADDPAFLVTRLCVEVLTPIPLGAFEVTTGVVRAGRKVRRFEASLATGGRAVARATALAVRGGEIALAAAPPPAPPPDPPEAGEPHLFPVVTQEVAGYALAVEVSHVRNASQQGGVAAWIRTRVPLVAGEEPSPLQRVMIAADSGNGIAIPADPRRFTFVNADLTVALHRPLEGDWVCLDAATARGPLGIGLTHTRLWDRRGFIGIAFQTLVIEPRGAPGAP